MATMVGTQKELGNLLNQLIELEYDAIEAYAAALQRLDDAVHKTQFTLFLGDHRRHVTELSQQAKELGQEPPTKADVKAVLTKGKVVLGGLIGDKAILLAMRTNETDTNTAYERAVARKDVPAHIRQAFQANLADERRHRSYIDQALGTSKAEAAAPPPR